MPREGDLPMIGTHESTVRDAISAADRFREWLTDAVAEGVYRGLSRLNSRTRGDTKPEPNDSQDDVALLTAGQVAGLMGLLVRRVYELAKRGDLPSVHIGRQIRFRRQAIEGWLVQREAQGRDSTGAQDEPPER